MALAFAPHPAGAAADDEVDRAYAAARAAEQQAMQSAEAGRMCDATASFLTANLSAPKATTLQNAALAAEAAGDFKLSLRLYGLLSDEASIEGRGRLKATLAARRSKTCGIESGLIPPEGNWPSVEVTVGCRVISELLASHAVTGEVASLDQAAARASSMRAHALAAQILAAADPKRVRAALDEARSAEAADGPGPTCLLREGLMPAAFVEGSEAASPNDDESAREGSREGSTVKTPAAAGGEGSSASLGGRANAELSDGSPPPEADGAFGVWWVAAGGAVGAAGVIGLVLGGAMLGGGALLWFGQTDAGIRTAGQWAGRFGIGVLASGGVVLALGLAVAATALVVE